MQRTAFDHPWQIDLLVAPIPIAPLLFLQPCQPQDSKFAAFGGVGEAQESCSEKAAPKATAERR